MAWTPDHSEALNRIAAEAMALLRNAERRLHGRTVAAGEEWRVVDDVADHLARLARIPSCPEPLGTVLLAWRDRLSSYALTGRALADAELSGDDVRRLLDRGIGEALAEAPHRTRALRDELTASRSARPLPATP